MHSLLMRKLYGVCLPVGFDTESRKKYSFMISTGKKISNLPNIHRRKIIQLQLNRLNRLYNVITTKKCCISLMRYNYYELPIK